MAFDVTRFRQIVRSFIYMLITWLDLNYPDGWIIQFMLQKTSDHLQCTHQILLYVSGMKDPELQYRASVAKQLVGYTDVDWTGSACDR